MKERKWLDENILMLDKNPKEYFKGVFKEIVDEIKQNKRSQKEAEYLLC